MRLTTARVSLFKYAEKRVNAMNKTIKEKIFNIIQIGHKDDFLSRGFDIFISVVIILNIAAMFAETFSELAVLHPACKVIELVTVIVFCIEYVLRIWTADLLYKNEKKGRAIIKFLLSYDGIVDLLTILPFFFLTGFILFRMLRVVRIFHLFRINAQYDSFSVITSVLKEKKNQILSSLFIIVVLMLASSICIYNVEHDIQPDVFRNAFSGIWWSMSTLLTVGYGDIYPITVVGKIMGIIIAFLGVGVVAIPTGIISAGFVEHYSRNQNALVKFNDISTIGEVSVTEDSGLAGLVSSEIMDNFGMNVILIIRDNMTLVPNGTVAVEVGDILVVKSDKLIKKTSGKLRRK